LKRFTENERMLDLLILQIMQGPYENVREYLTRLAQTATHKNISEHTLLVSVLIISYMWSWKTLHLWPRILIVIIF
jgi:MFS superfamily sulfate permease-like transporter